MMFYMSLNMFSTTTFEAIIPSKQPFNQKFQMKK